ncbi:hypothetical protein BDU57DRAFT_536106 [Ampelomyces quisqualis]|uniref:Homeobox domain-containing protein n=1 Tax=Ampelomyces quisqualis TaxID=50730 RepID=A0A6A5QX06_AMPQU|nr:hypothetical protein BDU57DRAFT_536106 [Ampelomyces quisqualis]
MLSPNDISPKGKAPSIWSIDSGYGSNTREDDECNLLQQSSYAGKTPSGLPQQPIGLGIGGIDLSRFRNVHVEDKLRLRRPAAPVGPVTTKLNVFTAKATSTTNSILPYISHDVATCITCQLWELTNPGEGLNCDDCKSKEFIRPAVLHVFDAKPDVKVVFHRLQIPQEPRLRHETKPSHKGRCTACDLAYRNDTQTPSTCTSRMPEPDLLSPISPFSPSTVRRSCARRHRRLPSHALHRLRTWLGANRDHPYPNSETKRTLAQECGLTEKQVTTWFTNTRARKLPLPNDRSHPSSEDEGAYESDFSSIADTPIHYPNPALGYGTPLSNVTNFAGSAPYEIIPSTLPASRRGKKKDYGRMNTASPFEDLPAPQTTATTSPGFASPEQETWQCTFCRQNLVPKSWRRHEETQHRPKYQWTCLADGPEVTIPSHTGSSTICVFCQVENPSPDHFRHSHRVFECQKKSEADRTFGRPDHLRQHIKNFHKTSMLSLVRDKWRRERPRNVANEMWKCGFCQATLTTWDMRETHIANHFKDGSTMASWIDPDTAPTVESNHDPLQVPSEEHTPILTNLTTQLIEHPIAHFDPQPQPQSQSHHFLPMSFDQMPPIFACSNIDIAPTLQDYTNMDFGGYMPVPDTFGSDYNFAGPSAIGDFGAHYPPAPDTMGDYYGDEALQLDFDAMANTDLLSNSVDYQNVWDAELQ